MRKLAIVAVAAVLAMALAGCASGGSSSAASGASSSAASSAASESSASADSSASVGLANPWSEAADAKAAADGAGLTEFIVPSSMVIGDVEFQPPVFRYMDGVAQADYEGGAVEFAIRKGRGLEGTEFTGDYNDYPEKSEQDIHGIQAACYGYDKDTYNLVTWKADDCSYCMYCNGLGGENFGIPATMLGELIGGIK